MRLTKMTHKDITATSKWYYGAKISDTGYVMNNPAAWQHAAISSVKGLWVARPQTTTKTTTKNQDNDYNDYSEYEINISRDYNSGKRVYS